MPVLAILLSTVAFVYICLISPLHMNDGVTVWCAVGENFLHVLHPGLPKVSHCTYDHQPFYFGLVKLYSAVFPVGLDPALLRIPNILFFLGAQLIYGLFIQKKFKDYTFTGLILLILFLNYNFFGEFYQVRMYAFYVFGISVLIMLYDNIEKNFCKFNLAAAFFSMFFYGVHLFTLTCFFAIFLKNKSRLFLLIKRSWASFFILVLSFLYKVPFVYQHRYVNRRRSWYQDESNVFFHFDHWILEPLMNHAEFLFYFVFIILALDSFLFRRKQIDYSMALAILILLSAYFWAMYIANMQEMAYRYILFVPFLFLPYCVGKRESLKTQKVYTVLFLVLFSVGVFNLKKRSDNVIADTFARRNLEMEEILKQNVSNIEADEICVLDNFYLYFNYVEVYLRIQNLVQIGECSETLEGDLPKFLVSTKTGVYVKNTKYTMAAELFDHKTDGILRFHLLKKRH